MQDPLRIVTLHKEDTETVIQTDKGAEELLLPSDLEKEQEKAEKKDNKEDKKRAEHEAAEANRKEEWKAKQQAKRIAEQEQLNHLRAMNNDEVTTASLRRVSADTERLTRRNMKECVSEHIQTLCLDSPDFARLVMHPKKNMIHCFRYIYRKAKAFIEQDMNLQPVYMVKMCRMSFATSGPRIISEIWTQKKIRNRKKNLFPDSFRVKQPVSSRKRIRKSRIKNRSRRNRRFRQTKVLPGS